MRFATEPLDETHRLDRLDSGRGELDRWLAEHARQAQARRTTRTFVWHRGDHEVIGYYALAAHLLQREDVPRSLGHGAPRQIPAVLLARLALDRSVHGEGIGGALLADAMSRVLCATRTVAARFVVVDAIDEHAARFYAHHGFRPIPEASRLVQRLSDVAAALRP